METLPFYNETQRLFHYVSTHNFDDLAELCDDDFGIVDLGPDGNNVMIRTRAEWENWFRTLFAQLNAMKAHTYTDILDYKALQNGNLGYSVVEFCQHLKTEERHGRFYCVVTIIWKAVGDRWKESRWHVSLLGTEWES